MPPFDTIAVVGASLAGVRAVQALRREGHTGRIVLVGAEDHWPPYDRPPLSKQVLTGAWESDRARLRIDDSFDSELVLGRRAVALDLPGRSISLDDGTSVAFDGLVVATGASPRTLPPSAFRFSAGSSVPAAPDRTQNGGDGVHALRTIDDCVRLRGDLETARRVAVVGAGFIGCEVASSCRSLGIDVTVIEALPLPLVRVLGPEMGGMAAELLRSNGVDLRLGIGVEAIEGGRGVERVILGDGSEVEADVVVVGIGVAPQTEWLAGSGLVVEDGLVCDEACVAVGSDGVVVAAGDVARWTNSLFDVSMRIEHWTNASDQAAHAARSLLHGGEIAGPFAPVPYFWSDQFGTKLQFVGTSSPTDEVVIVEGEVADRKFVAAYVRDGVVVGALCVNWPARTVPWRKAIEGREALPSS